MCMCLCMCVSMFVYVRVYLCRCAFMYVHAYVLPARQYNSLLPAAPVVRIENPYRLHIARVRVFCSSGNFFIPHAGNFSLFAHTKDAPNAMALYLQFLTTRMCRSI